MLRLTLVVLNGKKTAFFVMNVIKIAQNHSFTKMRMKMIYICNSCVFWKYYSFYMYIHSHTIGLIGVTELGTVTFHFAPNRRRFHWSVSQWILLHRKNIFQLKFKVELKFICAEVQYFSTFNKYHITILVRISHGNRSLTSYIYTQVERYTAIAFHWMRYQVLMYRLKYELPYNALKMIYNSLILSRM